MYEPNVSIQEPPSLWRNPRLWFAHLTTPYSAAERAGLKRTQWFFAKCRGYFLEQATQPQTIGYSLADSPSGLLAWIYEKLVPGTDGYPWNDDEGAYVFATIDDTIYRTVASVLTWISIHWFSRAGPAASLRIYYETVASNEFYEVPSSTVPCGLSFFPLEVTVPPRTYVGCLLLHRTQISYSIPVGRWARTIGNVVFESTHLSGGHFAAFEKPAELAADLRAMFGRGGPAFGVVSGKTGYDYK